MTACSTDLRDVIARHMPDLIGIRRDLHAHPELAYEEHRTSGVIRRELEAAGVSYVGNLAGGTGVLGHLPGTHERAVGLRADIDALPIEETSGVPHTSNHAGVMHACGHDGHTATLIGAARVLAEIAREGGLPRPVTFAFQPAEEGGAGGKRMVEDGCLDGSVIGPPIENMFGCHGWPSLPVGTVGTRPGPMLAAADFFEITITGLGGHAAMPHYGRDPIVAAAAVISALQTIASRSVDPLQAIVVSTTAVQGGTTHNVIPETVQLMGTVRTLLPETKELAVQRLHEIAERTAAAHQCVAEVRYEDGYPVTRNAPEAVDIFNGVARAALGAERVIDMELPVMGAEDFSYYCNEVPSCFFRLGLIPDGCDGIPSLHHSSFDFNDDAIATGVETFCRLALRAS